MTIKPVYALIVLAGLALCGSLSAGTLHVPGQYAAIQDAVDAAVNGDTVLVADGVYSGARNRDIDFLGKAIAVKSANGSGKTTIDCGGSSATPHRGFIFENGEGPTALLAGFTIVNGYAAVPGPYAAPPYGCGGGILCWQKSSPRQKTLRRSLSTLPWTKASPANYVWARWIPLYPSWERKRETWPSTSSPPAASTWAEASLHVSCRPSSALTLCVRFTTRGASASFWLASPSM